MSSLFEYLFDDWKTVLQMVLYLFVVAILVYNTVQSVSIDIKKTNNILTTKTDEIHEGQYIIKRAQEIILKTTDGQIMSFLLTSPSLIHMYVEHDAYNNRAYVIRFIIKQKQKHDY